MSDIVGHDQGPDPSKRIAEIRQRIISATEEAGKDHHQVKITAVSKKHTSETIEPALLSGHRQFGENRVQEALGKWPSLKEKYEQIELRLIGPLQTNKVKDVVGFFDAIETLDRPKLAKALAGQIQQTGTAPDLFVQVNTGEEPQKAGVIPQDTDEFIRMCRDEFDLTINGLMCIPPIHDVPAPHFALLSKIAARNGVLGLSMGMSADYEVAVQFGATHVRIGTEIFGTRPE